MNKIVLRGGIALSILVVLGSLKGRVGLQRAAGCSNPGFFGCKDKGPVPSEIVQPPADLKRAPPDGRPREAPASDSRYQEGHEYPWSRLVDDCMAAGGTRIECFASLPPDILEQFEAWEAEEAAQRSQQIRQRSRQPSFGAGSLDPTARD